MGKLVFLLHLSIVVRKKHPESLLLVVVSLIWPISHEVNMNINYTLHMCIIFGMTENLQSTRPDIGCF